MTGKGSEGLFVELGVAPVINAAAHLTRLGGSVMPASVRAAMDVASRSYVDMFSLGERAGSELAKLTHNEGALVSAGCAAGTVLAILAARTKGDLALITRLRRSSRVRDEVVMHTSHRNPYDWAVRLAGAKVREVGNTVQTFSWELEASLTERTVAVLYVAGLPFTKGALELSEVVQIAHARNVPVIVDAADQLPPVENLWRYTKEEGADVALFSGGKGLYGPQETGLMVGRSELIAAARANSAPHQRYARAMKVSKEGIAGLLAAVDRYVHLDHDAIDKEWHETCSWWCAELAGHGLRAVTEETNAAGAQAPRVRLSWSTEVSHLSSDGLVAALQAGMPEIVVLPAHGDGVYLNPICLQAGEEEVVLRRVLEELAV